ncbi:MAG TPA: GWxTD domain-containing protein [bacterium]|nr:GWxTD domain-containing protein [bacterium]
MRVFRTIFLWVLCWLVVATATASDDKYVEAEKCYRQALSHLQQNKSDLAINSLKQALRINRKLAKAHHQLALIYMNEGTVYGRFKATFEIDKAIRLDRDNLAYRFTRAELDVKKGMSYNAERQFKKILEKDPTYYDCYLNLAALKEDETLHYQDMISIESGSDGVIFMQKFAEELKQEAADYYKRAIAIQPENTEVYYKLALLYFEFDNFQQMIQLLESAVKINPRDKNCQLFLGFAYHMAGQFSQAMERFQLAKQMMSPDELDMLESIDLILSPQEMAKYQLASAEKKAEFTDRFWTKRDPFYLSPVNERLLEHYSRIAYTNLRFSNFKKGIEGWQTDRGKIYIRFGKPQYRYRTRPYIGEMQGNTRNPLVHSREFWIYPDFKFVFEDEYLSGNYMFARHINPEYDYKLIYENMIKETPDYYRMPGDEMQIDVPLEIVSFKGESLATELEFCYGVSAEQKNSFNLGDQLQKGLFVFDHDWQLEQEMKTSFRLQHQINIAQQAYFTFHDRVVVQPGQYHFALEFEDQITGKRAAIHRPIKADLFSADHLQISDILFASEIKPPFSSRKISRSDFLILPNPIRKYSAAQPVAIYFEIYNLTTDAEGNTRYEIEYCIGEDFASKPLWRRLLTNVGIVARPGETATRYEYMGKMSDEIQYQNLVLDSKIRGNVRLVISVTDLVSGYIDEKSEKLLIVE